VAIIAINDELFARLSNDFCEENQDIEDAILFLLRFYDETNDGEEAIKND
jgi:hypothetical protein